MRHSRKSPASTTPARARKSILKDNPLIRRLARLAAIILVANCWVGALAIAQVNSAELIQLPVCSATSASDSSLRNLCTVKFSNGHNEIGITLRATTSNIRVGGYDVLTENYNSTYITPVVEAMPGDTVTAHLVNMLQPRTHDGLMHGDGNSNPTNLHYFHGGIVTPHNARPIPAETGNGDNIYVHLHSDPSGEGPSNSFDLYVPIPGDQALDARVLERAGFISHPLGLYWYHSHLHTISSDQVMGGMSGLLSVGEANANVKAACRAMPGDPTKCTNDVPADTADLKQRTDVRYAMLRDIPLRNIAVPPTQADASPAEWDPSARRSPPQCGVWIGTSLDPDVKKRLGFCQRDQASAWLFTLNGQRFPTITLSGGRNLLLRMGNVSANVAYWLELYDEADGSVIPLTTLSVDGVVPARPVAPQDAAKPIQAADYPNMLLMPASRAEFYIRNDVAPHSSPKFYVLRTKGVDAGTDHWPEIQLARIVLQPNTSTSAVLAGLNALVAEPRRTLASVRPGKEAPMPEGCVRDLNPSLQEFRRVTFEDALEADHFQMMTELVQPKLDGGPQDLNTMPVDTTVTIDQPFESYVTEHGLVDWTKPHVCIRLDHIGSHKQLWVIVNATAALHNFHIHQVKFRLATVQELMEYHIDLTNLPARACASGASCSGPDFEFFNDGSQTASVPASPLWHDTMPVPPNSTVFLVMSFDAKEQVGRFVYHCHVLMHEDRGLMAPIEVWDPTQIAIH